MPPNKINEFNLSFHNYECVHKKQGHRPFYVIATSHITAMQTNEVLLAPVRERMKRENATGRVRYREKESEKEKDMCIYRKRKIERE